VEQQALVELVPLATLVDEQATLVEEVPQLPLVEQPAIVEVVPKSPTIKQKVF
jgi:hypothetical protein